MGAGASKSAKKTTSALKEVFSSREVPNSELTARGLVVGARVLMKGDDTIYNIQALGEVGGTVTLAEESGAGTRQISRPDLLALWSLKVENLQEVYRERSLPS